MITPTLKHAPYKGSTKAMLDRLAKPGDRILADSLKQALALYTVGQSMGIRTSRRRASNGNFIVTRLT
jgi:hypothetical protein